MRERTCIGCRKTAQKQQLFRIARTADGSVAFDATGKGPGRGAYVCSLGCFENAWKKGAIARALKCKVDAEVYDKTANSLKNATTGVVEGCEGC